MLSVAKHLLFLVEGKQKQIPRSARDDTRRGLFHQPARLGGEPETEAHVFAKPLNVVGSPAVVEEAVV
jgi:hypothetical protein